MHLQKTCQNTQASIEVFRYEIFTNDNANKNYYYADAYYLKIMRIRMICVWVLLNTSNIKD